MIIRFNGKDVDNAADLNTLVARTAPGDDIRLEAIRDGKHMTITVTLDALNPADSGPSVGEMSFDEMGFTVSNIPTQLVESRELSKEQEGVVITEIAPNGLAAEAGLREGDVVLALDGKPVLTVGDFEEAMHDTTPGDNVLFYLQRNGARVFVACETAKV